MRVWTVAALLLTTACQSDELVGPAAIVYEVQGQDSVRVRNAGGKVTRAVDLVFRAGSAQAMGCKVVEGADDGVFVGAESELVSITLRNFASGQEMIARCDAGTDLRYFRGEMSGGEISAYEEASEVPFRRTSMLWVVFLGGIAALMLLSFFVSLLLDRLFGRLGEA